MRFARMLLACSLVTVTMALPVRQAEARSPGSTVVHYVNKYRAK